MSHEPQSVHAIDLERLAETLDEIAKRPNNEHHREQVKRWIDIARTGAEYIIQLKQSKLLLEKLNMELSDKAIALAKQAGTLQAQLTAAQQNQQPAGTVPIAQGAADAINSRVADDGTIVPDAPAAPPVVPA